MTPLDALDLKILGETQRDATLPLAQIAERVNSSKSVCWRRIQRFQDEGIIRGRVTLLDAAKIGLEVTVLTFVKIDGRSGARPAEIIAAFRKIPQIVECHALMGEMDLFLKIVAPSIKAYEELLWGELSTIAGLTDVRSQVSLTQFISTTDLPLSLAPANAI